MTIRVKHPDHGFHECTTADIEMFKKAGYVEVKEEIKEVDAKEIAKKIIKKHSKALEILKDK
jgi:hypothetical protein